MNPPDVAITPAAKAPSGSQAWDALWHLLLAAEDGKAGEDEAAETSQHD